MKNILIIGAGRSAASLIEYLLEGAEENNWRVTVVDRDMKLAEQRVSGHPRGSAMAFEMDDHSLRSRLIEEADLVVSMLPATMHIAIAKECVERGVHLITPSYTTREMRALHDAAIENGVLLLNEMGVDPGIDHMSAMQIIHRLREKGARINRFESFTGGLVAPESDDNPWNYKFTWNPRNVVMAAQGGTAQFIHNHRLKYIPPHKIFKRFKAIEVPGYGTFDGYANRDSLSYRKVYDLERVPTIYRGTLRGEGFCEAWNVFVQLGITTEDFEVECEDMTYREFINAFLMYDEELPVEEKLKSYLDLSDEIMAKLEWLGIFEDRLIGLTSATPAAILQKLLEEKWSLGEDDKDMIVMWHRFDYEIEGVEHELHSSLVYIGRDRNFTAMSDTVGWPVAIAAKLILNGKLSLKGVQLPILPEIYTPILNELDHLGVEFIESEVR